MKRRTLLTGAAASLLSAPAIAQPARTATLRLVPQANLTILDPHFTTAIVTGNHGYCVFDTLYSQDAKGVPKPQMAEGHEVSADGRVWRITPARRPEIPRRHAGPARSTASPACSVGPSANRSGQTLAKVVEKWGAADDRTIEIRLTKPFPLLTRRARQAGRGRAFMMPERLAATDANEAR